MIIRQAFKGRKDANFEEMSVARFRELLQSGEFDKPVAGRGADRAGARKTAKKTPPNANGPKSLNAFGASSPLVRRGCASRSGLEEVLHKSCFDWIFLHEAKHPILKYTFHSPNGGRRSKSEAGRFKAMGVRKGVVDILNPFSTDCARGLAIELKAPGEKPTPEQVLFLEAAARDGYVARVCWTIDEFIESAQAYLFGAKL